MSAEVENLCSSKIKSYNIYNEKDVKNIISNNNESNLTKVKQRFSKSSGNFDTQSGSDNVSRRCSKIVKSPIEIENKDKENDNLNTTSHFLINCSNNNDNLTRNNSSGGNYYTNVICDKLTFKNSSHNSFKEDDNNELEISGKNLKSLFVIEKKNENKKEINNDNNSINNRTYSLLAQNNIKQNKDNFRSDFSNLNTIDSSKRYLSNIETTQKKNLLNAYTIPMFTKQLLLKTLNEYLSKNKPTIYSKEVDGGNIFGFSALTFRNSCPKSRTKVSININLNNKNGIFHFFGMHSTLIKKDILNEKYNTLSNYEVINDNFFSNIIGNLTIIKFLNDKVFVITNKDYNLTKVFCYRGIFSINNGNKIQSLNNIQNIPSQKCLDFIFMFNRGIFQVLSNNEITIILYKTLLENLLNDSPFEKFLEDIIINMFKASINYGGNRDMACLFICFENLKKIYAEKKTEKITEILQSLGTRIISNDEDDEKINDLSSPQKSIKIKSNNNNLTFKDGKSNYSEDTSRVIIKTVPKKKNFSFYLLWVI
jgi:hypothetical protein